MTRPLNSVRLFPKQPILKPSLTEVGVGGGGQVNFMSLVFASEQVDPMVSDRTVATTVTTHTLGQPLHVHMPAISSFLPCFTVRILTVPERL